MGRTSGYRVLPAMCAALVILLIALAAIQYRWSSRVAAADAQREKEHLDSAASLFASEFDRIAGQAAEFLENDARRAFESRERLAGVPKLIGEVYYLDMPPRGPRQAWRLTDEGLFEPAPAPGWIRTSRCTGLPLEEPPALVAPVFEITTAESSDKGGAHFLRTFSRKSDRCLVGRIDQAFLRDVLFPQLIRGSFGEMAAREYDFAVVPRARPKDALYGAPVRADVRRVFFSNPPARLTLPKALPSGNQQAGQTMIYVQRTESAIVTRGSEGLANLFGPGMWELNIAHKGLPLAAAFERTRRRDLLLSLAVEALLAAAIVFLVIGTRRMHRLADQKVRFVAGVSHELRTPVSAIAMLARNQADGLVTGADRVKQYGELIHQQSRRLNEMVEQTLQYAGIQSGLLRPVKHEVDLRRLIQEAVDAHRDELTQAEVALDDEMPPVPGDEKLLRIAIDNLLSNALKHADGGRWIRVSADYLASAKEVRISVEDRGAGIDPAEQAQIFEPFSRGRVADQAQTPGSGLGLSLVRSAAEAHHGSITLVSEPGRGSTFTLHLPV